VADDINQLRDKLREALWGNEAFTIGILQTVAGGAIFGIFSLGDERSGWAELLAAIVITLLGAALLFAIWAALFRHKYMMWNLKALVAKTPQEAKERPQWANNNLDRMRCPSPRPP
jgi:hypothetical protein